MRKKILVVTGGRADYGLLKWVMHGLDNDPDFELQIIATGSHFSELFGNTFREIEADSLSIDYRIPLDVEDDSALGITNSISSVMINCSIAFSKLNPDLVLVLGDRFEILAAAIACHVAGIPLAHLHGGEITAGAIDEAFRHSITKMSQIHFVANEEYRRRVIQLGEHPRSVHLVGGLGVDSLQKINLLPKEILQEKLGLVFDKAVLVVTFHPVTLEDHSAKNQMKELLDALSEIDQTTIIFTLPNSDMGGVELIKMVSEFVTKRPNSKAYESLGQEIYFSCIAHADAVVGNSSSGLAEVPSFKKPTVNIGDRQLGRIQASSVVNCAPHKEDILTAINFVFSEDFKASLVNTVNPYGEGGASKKIVDILKGYQYDNGIKKKFYDL